MKYRTWLAGFATLLLALPSLAVVKTYNADGDSSTKFPTDRRIYRGDCDANAPTPNAGDTFSDECACTASSLNCVQGSVPDPDCSGSAGRPGGGLCDSTQATGICAGGPDGGMVCTTEADCDPTTASGTCSTIGTCTGPLPGACSGGASPFGTCTAGLCVGGPNAGAGCADGEDCIECIGGTNAGAVCAVCLGGDAPTGLLAVPCTSHATCAAFGSSLCGVSSGLAAQCFGTCVGGSQATMPCINNSAATPGVSANCGTCVGGTNTGLQCVATTNLAAQCPPSQDGACILPCSAATIPLHNSPKPSCNKAEGGGTDPLSGLILIDDSGNGAPTLQSMVLRGTFDDFVGGATISGIPGTTVELHSVTQQKVAVNQTGVGSTSTSINWGSITGWTQTGTLFCETNCPGGCGASSSCKPFVGFEGFGPAAPLKASAFLTDPWTFTGDMHAFFSAPVELVSLGLGAETASAQIGGRLQQIPALPLAALGGLGAGLVYLGSRALRRKRN